MINGAHVIIYSTDPEADRTLLRDVLALPRVDVGQGWLIFGLPPSEVAVHPSDDNDKHELYLMCEDVEVFVSAMMERGIDCGPISDEGWGRVTKLALPGGGKVGVYEPRHERPAPMMPTSNPLPEKLGDEKRKKKKDDDKKRKKKKDDDKKRKKKKDDDKKRKKKS